MKLKIDWATLGKQRGLLRLLRSSLRSGCPSKQSFYGASWAAVKPVLLAAIGGGIVAVSGCTNMTTTPRGQTTEIVAVGVPAVAWITHTSQTSDDDGADTYDITGTNTTTVATPISLQK